MVLKLYGWHMSTCTLCVALILKEKNVPFEFCAVDLANGEHKTASFLSHQPFGQVPYIDDDGFILYESRAIARYIATKHAFQGTSLIPDGSDVQKLALFEQAVSSEAFNYNPLVSALSWELRIRLWFGERTDHAQVEQLQNRLRGKLDAYEVILSKQKYLAGDEVTLADLFHLPYGTFILDIGIDEFSTRPNVNRWWKDISSRIAWQAVKGGVA